MLVAGGVALLGIAPHGRAATFPPLTGGVSGPSIAGLAGKGTYTVTASGGPAEAPNGSQAGIYSFKASLAAFNTTGAIITPDSGVLINGSATLSFVAPNLTESLTIYVDVTSSLGGTNNVSQNFSIQVQIVQPYRLQATLSVASSSSIAAFRVTVLLERRPRGHRAVSVPTLPERCHLPPELRLRDHGTLVGVAYVLGQFGTRTRPRHLPGRERAALHLVLRSRPAHRLHPRARASVVSPSSSGPSLYLRCGSAPRARGRSKK